MEQTKAIKRKFAPVHARNTSEPEEIGQFKRLVTNCSTGFDSSNEKENFVATGFRPELGSVKWVIETLCLG